MTIGPTQVARIERVHRGFLYQHIYGALCLLRLRSRAGSLIVENDEDLELESPEEHLYIQVKYRSAALTWSDIKDSVGRFDAVIAQHRAGARSGEPTLVIACNSAPHADVLRRLGSRTDVRVAYPDGPEVANLPRPPRDISSALAALTTESSMISLAAIAPSSLAFKLAAFVQLLATGHDEHRIAAERIAHLFDLVVEQLHEFPAPPVPYYTLQVEPDLVSAREVRLLLGFSGAGKTAWAAQMAAEAPEPVTYFDVSDIPSAAVVSSLARELAGRFIEQAEDRAVMFAVDQSGPDIFRAVARRVVITFRSATVVIDNAHLLEPDIARRIVEATRPLRIVFLAQPSATTTLLSAELRIQPETFEGWSDDTIALTISKTASRADPATILRLRGLTGGLPLYVLTAATVASESYGGDVADFCTAIETRTNVAVTPQEALLERTVETLPETARKALAVFALVEIPVSSEEARVLAASAGIYSSRAVSALRELVRRGILQPAAEGMLRLHDAFRPLALAELSHAGSAVTAQARSALRDLLGHAIKRDPNVDRLRLWMRLLAETNDIETLIDVALDEMIHQIGGPEVVRQTLESAADSPELSPSKRFWALDALAFWDAQRDQGAHMLAITSRMATILEGDDLGPRERASLSSKQMLVAARQRDRKKLRAAYEQGLIAVTDDALASAIFRYNYALSLQRIGAAIEAGPIALTLINEYYAGLGLTPGDVLARNLNEIARRIKGSPSPDTLSHLADTLHLYSRTPGLHPGGAALARLHALKFYALANAPLSVVSMAQNVVNDLIAIGDPQGARMIMETDVLPIVSRYGLVDSAIDVRAQYAVVLALAGDVPSARREMEALENYQIDPQMRAQLAGQRELIDRAAGRAIAGGGGSRARIAPKVGRNDLCPCGSKLKFKKCHGRP